MKPNFVKTDNPQFDSLLLKLNKILTNLNLDNFQYQVISAKTASAANTQFLLYHGFKTRPWCWIVIKSDSPVFVFNYSNDWLDVRSLQTNVNFEILILG